LAQSWFMTARAESNCQLRGDEAQDSSRRASVAVAGKNLNLRTELWMQAGTLRVAQRENIL